jgi:hypothetical protein
VKYLDQYSSTVRIYQFDTEGNFIYGVKLNHAFPTAIASLELDAGAMDQIHKLNVTFSYYDYEVIKNSVSTTIASSLSSNK